MVRTRSFALGFGLASFVIAATSLGGASAALAQDKPPAGSMSKEQQTMMDTMIKAATPGANHKLLASLVGEWTFVNKMWMDPAAPPTESTGTASYQMALDGRYLHGNYGGTMSGMAFEGHGLTAYDNVTQQFQSAWIDNFGTGITFMTGKYDPATKALTFRTEMADPMKPGTLVKVRQVIRLTSPDQHVMEWYESRGGKETKTMEIVYTRKK
jgi:hypothetical protein